MSASTRTYYTSPAGSVAVDSLTKQILNVMNRLLKLEKFGGEEEVMTATQGSWRPWTSYSGPTHRGCAAIDLTAWNATNRVIVGDLLGAVLCHRTPQQGPWVHHIHMLTRGMGCIDPYAQGQIDEVMRGGDGLKGNQPDPDARFRSGIWPLAIYQGRTGIIQATQDTRIYDGPSSHRKMVAEVPKGTKTTAIMEVRNDENNVWFVTDKGEWGYSPKWVKV